MRLVVAQISTLVALSSLGSFLSLDSSSSSSHNVGHHAGVVIVRANEPNNETLSVLTGEATTCCLKEEDYDEGFAAFRTTEEEEQTCSSSKNNVSFLVERNVLHVTGNTNRDDETLPAVTTTCPVNGHEGFAASFRTTDEEQTCISSSKNSMCSLVERNVLHAVTDNKNGDTRWTEETVDSTCSRRDSPFTEIVSWGTAASGARARYATTHCNDELTKSSIFVRGGASTIDQLEGVKVAEEQAAENKSTLSAEGTQPKEDRQDDMVSADPLSDVKGEAQNAVSESNNNSSSSSSEMELLETAKQGLNQTTELEEEDDYELSSGDSSSTDESSEEEDDFDLSSVMSRMGQRFKQHKLWEYWKMSNNNRTTSTTIKKRKFLDRIALVSNALIKSEHDANIHVEDSEDWDEITPQSDLTRPGRYISVVTTAALPWMTGTAVNPLLRAAYLCRKTKEINNNNATTNNATNHQWVTLVVPWLELEEDRLELYGPNHVFADQEEQEQYIRNWLATEADMPDVADPNTGLRIMFYPARYHSGLKSIFAMGDVCSPIPNKDVCILEEPEHLNWYRAPGQGWTKQFNYVVGIVHTNYKEYASAHYSGLWTAPAIAALSSAMVRAYCHKVIKLSDVLQTFAPEKEETSNVHGVRSDFLKEGERRSRETTAALLQDSNNDGVTRVYFIGKILWAKGLDLLLELQSYYRQCTGEYFAIDVYGSGPELREITRAYHGRKQYQGEKKMERKAKRKARRERRKRRRRARRSDSDIRILGTTIPFSIDSTQSSTLFSMDEGVEDSDAGSSSVEEESPSESDNDVKVELFDTQQALDYLQVKARKKLAKIKKTIKTTTESLEFDLPKSFNELRREPIPAKFPGRVDHALLKEQHKVFVNPSITEVLCTTTAEALAMGKFVIIPVHPSNAFFLKFPNCLAYRNKFEFVANLKWALAHEPEPLTPELAHEFTGEAATERFIHASAITLREAREREKLGTTKLDERIAWFHNEIGKGIKGDTIRKVLGAGPASHQHRYQIEREAEEQSELFAQEGGEEESEGEEDEEEGLPDKFYRSSLAEAIRSTVINGLPATMVT